MPSISISRSTALVLASLVLAALVVAGPRLAGTGTASVPEAAAPLEVVSAPRSKRVVVVHVVGAVRRPGLLRLPEGSRVADAVRRAGGASRSADLAALNLAAPLADGAQVLVPVRTRPAAGAPAGAAESAATGAGPVAKPSLSSATIEELDELPGVGPVTAQRIVEYRTAHGPFGSVDDLDAVPGIGPSRLEQLRDLVTP